MTERPREAAREEYLPAATAANRTVAPYRGSWCRHVLPSLPEVDVSPTTRQPDPGPLRLVEHTSAETLTEAVAWLQAAEAATGIPLVDESESERLRQLGNDGSTAPGWWCATAERAGQVVGYVALVRPEDPSGMATGDVAVGGRHFAGTDAASIRSYLLSAVTDQLDAEVAASVQVWMRDVTEAHLEGVEDDGFVVARRLGILGRDLTDNVEVAEVPGIEVRAFQPGSDDDAVVEILARAYEGTGDGGWTPERFARRQQLPWFRADDLLLAQEHDGGRILGLHWLKRRGEGVGEVYNLAIHPAGQGRGLGGLLLTAGLAHLGRTGCHEVLLWVDRANDPAVKLYTSRGFETRWDDVALQAELT